MGFVYECADCETTVYTAIPPWSARCGSCQFIAEMPQERRAELRRWMYEHDIIGKPKVQDDAE